MGGDGFYSRVDPKDPNTIYANMQNGGMVRFDKRTGERVSIQPQPAKGDPALRWNWDAPFIISPHSNTRLYFGAQKLYRSDDRGDRWRPVSPDLTRDAGSQQAAADGQGLAHRRHPEERLHGALRQHFVDRRIAQEGRPDLRRHRRRPGAGHRGRRQDTGAKSRSPPACPRTPTCSASWRRSTMPARCTWPTRITRTATSSPT